VRQLQCKTLRGREKRRRRKNNGEQWKNNGSSDRNNEVRNQRWRSTRQQKPAVSSGGRRSHKSETRISAFADLSREGKQKRPRYPRPQSTVASDNRISAVTAKADDAQEQNSCQAMRHHGCRGGIALLLLAPRLRAPSHA
jgi:hypothetical protein